ncbi:phosphatidylglycerol lysyltransferase domain-containing protein, partial [Streptomyces cirratus]
PDSENGLMEFMVIELLERSKEIGVTQVSLNLRDVPFRLRTGVQLGAGPVLRMWRSLLSFFSRWWQIESLYGPTPNTGRSGSRGSCSSRRVPTCCCRSIAAGRAEGFLEAPGLPKWLHRRHLETRR